MLIGAPEGNIRDVGAFHAGSLGPKHPSDFAES